MKKIFTIGMTLFCIGFSLNAQVNGFFELTVTDLPGAATNRVVVKMKAINSVVPMVSTCDGNDAVVTNILTGMTFGIKWPVSSGITQVAITSGSVNNIPACDQLGDPAFGYGIAAGGAPIVNNAGTHRVRPFLANFTPSAIPVDWIGNQWITICTLSLTGGNCTVCEALDIYVEGEYPEIDGAVDVAPRWVLDQTGANNVIYIATPNNGPLPLNLISFKANKSGEKDAYINWTTANEENTSHFIVQRSFDKHSWSDVGSVGAAGYSIDIRNYELYDANVNSGRTNRLQVYYRLKMIDLDGRLKLSPIQSVVFNNGSTQKANEFLVYPNPASDGVQIEWDATNLDQPTSLEFYDVAGKLIHVQKVSDNTNQEYVDFGHTNIQAGLYLLRIMSGTEPIEHKQIVVNR